LCSATASDTFDSPGILAMAVFKSGDLVVLKSGGPIMTIDAVNTDIFDDNKITGVVCVWFVGQKLERFRFEQGAIQLAEARQASSAIPPGEPCLETTEDYKLVLDNMVGAMNTPLDHTDVVKSAPRRQKSAVKAGIPKNTH
jgi:uncharacterized protein YodC (DUF2158 family)